MIRNTIDNFRCRPYDDRQEETTVYICLCHGITDSQIRGCIERGARSLCDLRGELGVATQCGSCAEQASQMLDEQCSPDASALPSSATPRDSLTPLRCNVGG
jgi:bacterioferritin-associated ferredoxin